ncbi:MAG TPA: endonuclease/exonuclease/phosphatase family protein [Chthoniobacteraceae bacterium]|jgi:endonuclease/exonuclease/phosphatase (EEP) superfamily protein YafD|nr:endonuclease/exonuclease/phosphatase family protein [Chthoniobacteraceae bacterium]
MKSALPSLVRRVAAGSLRVWLIAGILLRITKLRDAWRPLSLVYYSTPWPVMAVGLLILALHARRVGHAHAKRRYFILTGGALFTWIALSWFSAPAPAGPPAFRLVAWNTGHPARLFGPVTRWLQAQDADVIAIAESTPEEHDNLPQWRAGFPNYQVVQARGEMICLARGDITMVEEGLLGLGSYYALYHARIRGEDLTILQADLTPTQPRLAPLRRLTEIARAHAGEKLIVVGDLNTPRESKGFDDLRGFMSHAFEKAGTGLAETWPTWAPALSIDHVWSSGPLPPRAARIGWPMWSDHRPVVVEF